MQYSNKTEVKSECMQMQAEIIWGHFTLATAKHLVNLFGAYFDPLISSTRSLDCRSQTLPAM